MRFIEDNFEWILRICNGLIIGFILGYWSFYSLGPVCEFCEIQYISQDELIALEKKRIANPDAKDEAKNIFFGKPQEAIKLITEIAKSKQGRNNKILLTSGSIEASGIKSISLEVHKLVIDNLKAQTKK